MTTLVIWATVLIAIALLLLLAEMLIPSGGIISIFAGLSLVGGLVCLYLISFTAGLIGTVVTLIVLPVLIVMAVKTMPNTPMGRRVFLNESQQSGVISYDPNVSRSGEELIGQEGVAETEMRPVGTVRLDGKRIECFAEGGIILAGSRVKVTRVQGMEIKVRPAD